MSPPSGSCGIWKYKDELPFLLLMLYQIGSRPKAPWMPRLHNRKVLAQPAVEEGATQCQDHSRDCARCKWQSR